MSLESILWTSRKSWIITGRNGNKNTLVHMFLCRDPSNYQKGKPSYSKKFSIFIFPFFGFYITYYVGRLFCKVFLIIHS